MAKTKKTMYAILETHFEYDDNYYNATEGYSSPIKIFKSEKKAREACDLLNEDFIGNNNLTSYLTDGIDSMMLRDGIEYVKQFRDLAATIMVHNDIDLEIDYDNLQDYDQLEKFVKFFQVVYHALPKDDERRSKLISLIQTVPFSVHEVLVEE